MIRMLLPIILISIVGAQAETSEGWKRALENIDCGKAKKNENGSWTISETIIVEGTRFENPTIRDADQVSILEQKCPRRAGCGLIEHLRGLCPHEPGTNERCGRLARSVICRWA